MSLGALSPRGEILCLVARIALSHGAPSGEVLTLRLHSARTIPDVGDGLVRQERRYLVSGAHAVHVVDLVVCIDTLDGEAHDGF